MPNNSGFSRLFDEMACTYDPKLLKELGLQMSAVNIDGSSELDAGYTYFGQFLDHDMTLMDRGGDEPVAHAVPVGDLKQLRNPALDLDSIYGSGLDDARVAVADDGSMLLGSTVPVEGSRTTSKSDLPRGVQGVAPLEACIPDARNDEHLLISQLHVLFLQFHNAVVACSDLSDRRQRFEFARREVTNTYQHIVLYDFLPRILNQQVYDEVVVQGRFQLYPDFQTERPSMPIEFAAAAFRYGHALVRDQYRLNDGLRLPQSLKTLIGMTAKLGFEDQAGNKHSGLPENMRVQWDPFFFRVDPNGFSQNLARPFSPSVHLVLRNELRPGQTLVMAQRNLVRGVEVGLPGAHSLIHQLMIKHPELAPLQLRTLAYDELNVSQVLDFVSDGATLAADPPLWFFILAEAYSRERRGQRLGPLGSLIVANTVVGVLKAMPNSILTGDKGWQPQAVKPAGTTFKMADILTAVDAAQA